MAEALRISRVALTPPNQRQWQPFVAQTAVASATYILEHRQQFEDLAGLHDGLRILQAFPDWFMDQIWRKTKRSVINMNQYYIECPFYRVPEHGSSRLMSWRLLTFYAPRHDKRDTVLAGNEMNGKKRRNYTSRKWRLRLRALQCLLNFLTLKMKAPRSFETSGTTYPTRQCYIPEDNHSPRLDNPASHPVNVLTNRRNKPLHPCKPNSKFMLYTSILKPGIAKSI